MNPSPHRNPDGTMILGNHIHIYSNKFADKFAFALPDDFVNCKTISDYLNVLLDYCHVTGKPKIEMGLFV